MKMAAHVVAEELVDRAGRIDTDRRLHRRSPALAGERHRRRGKVTHLDAVSESGLAWAHLTDDDGLLVPLLNVLPDSRGGIDRPVRCACERDVEDVGSIR